MEGMREGAVTAGVARYHTCDYNSNKKDRVCVWFETEHSTTVQFTHHRRGGWLLRYHPGTGLRIVKKKSPEDEPNGGACGIKRCGTN